jgi:hypothetical protein
MKPFLLLLAIAFAADVSAAGTKELRAFYCIHAGPPCRDTEVEAPVTAAEGLALARRVLTTKDDFLGFIDAADTTLQFYVEEVDSIIVDMPVPNLQGSYATHVNREQALKLIAGLSPPLARYRSSLKLQFAKWK